MDVKKDQWWAVTAHDVYAYRNGIEVRHGFPLQRGMFVEIIDDEPRIVDNLGPFHLVKIIGADYEIAHERVLVKTARFETSGLTFRFPSKRPKPLPDPAR